MKLLKPKQRIYSIRVSRIRWLKRLNRKNTKLRDLRIFAGTLRICAPATFSLETPVHRTSLLKFVEKVRNLVVLESRSIIIDFRDTARLVAGGTLLFYAEITRALQLASGGVKVRCKPPRNVKVAQALKQIGLLDMLGCNKRIVPTMRDVIHWRYATGHQVDGSKYENILGTYEGKVTEALLDSLFRGISEAMTNCHHHAYISPRNDGLNVSSPAKTWWMFSQEKDGFLTVVFCDLGVGIPETLPTKRPTVWRQLLSLGKAGSDAEIIKYAIQDSITRTGKTYRGKGLKQLLEAVQEHKSGALRIFSNHGCYTYHKENEKVRDYSDSILGTLIHWRIPITQGALI